MTGFSMRVIFFVSLLLILLIASNDGESLRSGESRGFCSPCAASEESASLTFLPGLGQTAEAILKGKGQPMWHEGELLIIGISDRKKTISNLTCAYKGLVLSMQLNEENIANRNITKTIGGVPYL
jgi:hypothetical protein